MQFSPVIGGLLSIEESYTKHIRKIEPEFSSLIASFINVDILEMYRYDGKNLHSVDVHLILNYHFLYQWSLTSKGCKILQQRPSSTLPPSCPTDTDQQKLSINVQMVFMLSHIDLE